MFHIGMEDLGVFVPRLTLKVTGPVTPPALWPQTGALTPEAGEQELNEFLANVRPLADVMHNYEVLHKVTMVAMPAP